MKLSEMKNGQKGKICKVRGIGAFRKRILEMGFIVGQEVEVIKNAPLQDPIEYKIMGYNVSLRRSDAELIGVKREGEEFENHKEYSGVINEGGQKLTEGSKRDKKVINVALVGNPNCGKTTLFNFASNSKERVGNYGGVTVDAKEAVFFQNGYEIRIMDLPGTYSLSAYSPEELYVRRHIFEKLPDIVLNVIDSSNLERNLYLTTQLIDMDIKIVVGLNMYDELKKKGDDFNYHDLGKLLGIPFVPLVSSKGIGVKDLFGKIIEVFEDRDDTMRHIHINYGEQIETCIKNIQEVIRIKENSKLCSRISPRFLSVKLLEQDAGTKETIRVNCSNSEDIFKVVENQISELKNNYQDDPEAVITDAKYGFIAGALKETFVPGAQSRRKRTELIDTFVTHKLWGYPIFIFFMWLMFQATFTLGDPFMGWIEEIVGLFSGFIGNILSDGMLKDLIIDGVIGGVGGVLVFLPNILILFFFISFLEDTGYMARAVFIMDKIMHKFGLHGKSFIPLIMGFGCNVPAVMATRTIESRNNRMITMLINPFMSCGARLPVYVLLISAFFPKNPGTMLFTIYALGVLAAMGSAILLKKFLFKGEDVPFVMELPPYRMPTLKSTSKHMWDKGVQYLKKMGGVILVASILIWALGYFPREVNYKIDYDAKIEKITEEFTAKIENADEKSKEQIKEEMGSEISEIEILKESERQENSYIGKIGHIIEPVIAPLGFDWKIGVALVTGLAAKEVVVSTMGVLYQADLEADETSESLMGKLQSQEFPVGHPREGQKVFSGLVAFGLMVFVLLYVPCVAVIAAINRESGSFKWALFNAVYSTSLAYIFSLLIYQIGKLFI
ncbi:MAG: ferrous iron transport protein B [Candidatus Delongbacteria bacterium]|nr:ferrous iron transport protein B [Candidatus Delongbacteria bacterium]MBN2834846.1 ferrous iron transport protein B [Candidatus Delongbacteria bacterium]